MSRPSALRGKIESEEAETRQLLVLGLGGNSGDTRQTLVAALRDLEPALGPLVIAPLYRTAPISDFPQPDFLNTVVLAELRRWPDGRWFAGERGLSAEEVLAVAKALELRAGRRRRQILSPRRFGPRPLDIDILLFGAETSQRPELTLPHPRLRQRRFVLAPLADVAPRLPLPPDGTLVRDALAALDDEQQVERLLRQPGDGLP